MHCGQRFERLCKYVARPPLATERLTRLDDGRLCYRLKRRWRDGTTQIVLEPLDLVARLAALVPPPRVNTVRYHGILAPCAGWRDVILRDRSQVSSAPPRSRSCPCQPSPAPGEAAQDPATGERDGAGLSLRTPVSPASAMSIETAATSPEQRRASAPTSPRERRLPWSELLRRVFAVDALQCDRCGGRMRIVAAIDQPEVIRGILECLGPSSRAPPLTPAPSPETTDLELGFEESWPSDEPGGEG
jgi:hypothetical protein